MLQYVDKIIVLYVRSTRDSFSNDTPALVIMDNFKGQITSSVIELLESNNIHVCLLPANTTNQFQPMDLSVNKPAKDFLKRCFEDWYAEQAISQLDGREMESTDLEPVNLGVLVLKELGAKWLVQMAEYFVDNSQIIVNGFVKAGIAAALNVQTGLDNQSEELREMEGNSEDDFEIVSSDEAGIHTGFWFGGGDSTPRGVWGHVPPGKCQIMSILNGFWGGGGMLLGGCPRSSPPLYESLRGQYLLICILKMLALIIIVTNFNNDSTGTYQ